MNSVEFCENCQLRKRGKTKEKIKVFSLECRSCNSENTDSVSNQKSVPLMWARQEFILRKNWVAYVILIKRKKKNTKLNWSPPVELLSIILTFIGAIKCN